MKSYKQKTPNDCRNTKNIEDLMPTVAMMNKQCCQICATDCSDLCEENKPKNIIKAIIRFIQGDKLEANQCGWKFNWY